MKKTNLNYADNGSPLAEPVFVFHGAPGSKREHPQDLSICNSTNSRLIIVERPGYGTSDIDDQRQLLDWPNQITALADALGISQFSILGFSGGGAYALACGAKIPERVKRISLVGSVAPFDIPSIRENMIPGNQALFELAAEDYQQAAQQLAELIDGPDTLLQFLDDSVSEPDKLILAKPDIREMYRQNLAEAIHQGMAGLAYDMALIASPWNFDPADINVEVQIWHGGKDINVPIEMGKYLANVIPNSTTHFLPDEGHWLLFPHYQEILENLLTPDNLDSVACP